MSSTRVRSALASVVGWVLVAVVLLWALRLVAGTVLWLVRSLLVAIVVVALVVAYLWLKAPDDES